MALLSKFHIGILNELENLTVTSTPTAETAHPIANITDQKKGKVTRWDMTSDTLVSIKGTSATAVSINSLFLKGHNLASDSSVRLRAFADASQAGTLLLDSASDVYANFPGAATDYFDTPDSAAASITGDITVICRAALDDWTPASAQILVDKWQDTGSQRSYRLYVLSSGQLIFAASDDGTSSYTFNSPSNPTVSDGAYIWIKIECDVDNGAAGSTCEFFTSTDFDPDTSTDPTTGTWTSLGSETETSLGAISIFDSTAPVQIGLSSTSSNPLDGKMTRALIYSGTGGSATLNVDFDPRRETVGTTTFNGSTGETWTIQGSATVEETLDPVFIAIPSDEAISGLNSWGSYYGPDSDIDSVFSLAFDAITPKSVQIDLHVPTPASNIAEIDKLALAFLWAPDTGIEWRTRFSVEGEADHLGTMDGGLYTPSKRPRRRMECNMPVEGRHSAAKTLALLERRGKHGDLYVMENPNAVGQIKHMGTSIFRRDTDAEKTRIFFDGNQIPLILREN